MPRELFETRSQSWHAVGLGSELEPRTPRRTVAGFFVAVLVMAAVLFVYTRRGDLLPGYGQWVRAATAAVLIVVGLIAVHWFVRAVSPRMYRRLDPATAGTIGFLARLLLTVAVIVAALRIAGVHPATLAVGGAVTAVVLGLAAQQTLGSIFAGILLQSTRPFRVGERVRLVGGMLAGSIEGTVSSLGLFYTTLIQGDDRLLIPNSVLIQLAVVPLREPDRVDVRARFGHEASPRRVEERLLSSVRVPTRHAPHVALEEVDEDGIVLRISATPLLADEGSQLAEEVLDALRRTPSAAATGAPGAE